jgi:cytochrome c oxidase subunit 2
MNGFASLRGIVMLRARAVVFAWLVSMSVAASGHQSSPENVKVIDIVAERFSFTPSEITIDAGASVELRLRSEDTDHGFRLRGPDPINVIIPKRGRGDARVKLVIDQPGAYVFECSHVCGAGHGFMRGTLRVRTRENASASNERRPGQGR